VEISPESDGIPDLIVDNVDLRVLPGASGLVNPCATPVNETPLGTNLIQNGDFSQQTMHWVNWGITDAWTMQPDGAGGLVDAQMLFMNSRYEPGDGGLYQDLDFSVPANAALALSVDIGNTSDTPKSVQVILSDTANGQQAICTFDIAPGTAPQPYHMRLNTQTQWINPRLEFKPAADGIPDMVLDNVDLELQTGQGDPATVCDAPG
jgi:hypothetical protein